MSETPTTTPALRPLRALDEVPDDVVLELLSARSRHGWQRVLSIITMSAAAIGVAEAGWIAAPWSGLVMYGVPISVMLLVDKVLVALWTRQAHRYGLSQEAVDDLRARVRALPARSPPYRPDELLTAVRQVERLKAQARLGELP